MYTIPAKVTVQTKTLIEAFEKGELKSLSTLEEEEEELHVKPAHPELYEDELAEPGTARKLLQAFEFKRQQSLTSPPPTSVEFLRDSRRLSVSRFVSFEEKSELEKRRIAKALLLNGNGLGVHSNGAEIKVEQVNGMNGETTGINGAVETKIETAELVNGSISNSDNQNSIHDDIHTSTIPVASVNGSKIEMLIEEDLLQKVDQKVNEKIEEKIEDKIEEKIEEKVQEVIEQKTEENVEAKVEESAADTSKPVTEATVIVTETVITTVTHTEHVTEAFVDVTNNNTEEHVSVHAEVTQPEKFQERTEGQIAESVEAKIEEKIDERLEERIEEVIEEKVAEKLEEKVLEIVEENKQDIQIADEVRQGTVLEMVEKVEERVLEGANEELLSDAAEMASVDIIGDAIAESAERNVQEIQKRNVLLISAIKPENDLDKALREATIKVLEESGSNLAIKDVFDNTTPDYEEERGKLLGADMLIFHYRPILNSPPALLKSWLEGALIQGDGTPVDKVTLQGRKALLLVTCADEATDENTAEKLPFISSIQDSVLRAYDMDIHKPYIIFQAGSELAEKTAKIEEWDKTLSAFIKL